HRLERAGGGPAMTLWAGMVILALLAADDGPREVEPSELTRRPELVGREVVVDDRVKLFILHEGTGFDEILLQRTPVVFRLPPDLRYQHPPDERVVRLKGVLRKAGDPWVCDVKAVELMPSDIQRLERAIAVLPPNDAEHRAAWARWAERRGTDFRDPVL